MISPHSTTTGITFTATAQRDDRGDHWPTVSITKGTAVITAPTLPVGWHGEPYPTWYARVYTVVPDASGAISVRIEYPEAHGTQRVTINNVEYSGPVVYPAWTQVIDLPHWSPADFNADGFTNGDDYDSFSAAFDAGNPIADWNGDGWVNGDDYDSFSEAFEKGTA